MALQIDYSSAEQQRQNLTLAQQKRIEQLYRQLSKELAKEASKAPRVPSDIVKQQYLENLKKEIDKKLYAIQTQLGDMIKDNMKVTADVLGEDTVSWLAQFGLPVDSNLFHVSEDIVQSIVSGQLYEGNWSLSKALWKDHMKVQSDVQKVIAQDVAAQKSSYEIAKDIEKYVNPDARKDWEWSKVYPGTAKKVDYNAQRLARTMVSHAYQQAFVRNTQKNPFVTKYQWLASNSDRTCELCEERDGKYFDKDDLPLDHPNGMCTFVAVIDNSMEEVADRLADWYEGKDDPELDEYLSYLTNGAQSMELKFTELQEKWLTPNGYSVSNMPSSFTEWSHSLTSAQKQELFDTLGLHGAAHPFQELNKWYDQCLANVTKQLVTKDVTPPSATNIVDLFSQVRKDAALWAKTSEEADKLLRDKCGEVWRAGSQLQRTSAYHYTWGSGPFNTPLRIGSSWDLRGSDYQQYIPALTDLINTSSYDIDIWLQRGVDYSGGSGFFGIDSSAFSTYTEDQMKAALLGTVRTDDAFFSCATAKGKGFNQDIILNVYCPSGTKMLYCEPFSHYSPDRDSTGGLNWDGITKQGSFGSESEMLLQRGGSYRVVKVEKGSSGTWYFDIEVVDQDPTPEGKNHPGK